MPATSTARRPRAARHARKTAAPSASPRHDRQVADDLKPRRPRTTTINEIEIVTGDDRAPHARMFPRLAVETVEDPALWTPERLRPEF